ISSVKLMAITSGLIAALALPFVSFVPRLLSEGRDLSDGTVAGFLCLVGGAGVVGALTARRWVPGEVVPQAMLQRSVWLLAGSGGCWVVGASLPAAALFVLLAVSAGLLAAAGVLVTAALLCVVHPSLRTAASALQGMAAG